MASSSSLDVYGSVHRIRRTRAGARTRWFLIDSSRCSQTWDSHVPVRYAFLRLRFVVCYVPVDILCAHLPQTPRRAPSTYGE